MSNRRKNNHYHYAEKFEDRRRSAAGKRVFMPFKSVIISLVVLLMFGFICTTFSVYVTDNAPEDETECSPIISEVRNMKASRDIALTGANADLAGTGWSIKGGTVYFDATGINMSSKVLQYAILGDHNGTQKAEFVKMNKVANCDIYYGNPNASMSNPWYIVFFTAGSTWNGYNDSVSNILTNIHNNASWYSKELGHDVTNGSKYYVTKSSTSSNATVTWSTSNPFTSTQTVSLIPSNVGNKVKQTCYWWNDGNPAQTSNDNVTDSANYNNAVKSSTCTLVATPYSDSSVTYIFDGYYSSNSTFNSTTLLSSNTTYSYSVNGNKTVYARFIARYTISTAKSPNAYTGSPTVNNASSVTINAGDSVTLNADVKTGVTFNGWSFSSGGSNASNPLTLTPTGSFTATASYTLKKPTGLSLSYPTIVAGNTSTPTKSATSPAGNNGTLNYSFTSITPQSGTTAASGTYSVDFTTGVVTVSTPGKYTVTMSVTNTAYGLTSAASTATATVTVKPVAPTGITIEATNADSGEGTFAVPYKIPVNRTKFNIKSYIPIADRNASYTYNWTRTDGTYLLSNGTITTGSNSATTENTFEVTDTASAVATDVIHNAILEDTKGYIYKIALTSNQNGVASDPYYCTIYYGVTADFLVVESFDFKSFNNAEPIQKIYAEDNNINHIDAVYDAGGTKFDTVLKFSKDRITSNDVAVWTDHGSFTVGSNPSGSAFNYIGTYTPLPDDSSHTVSSLITTISTIARNSVNLMSTTGPKWFGAYVDDYQNARIGAQTPDLHTTVGTASTVADRPIYYVDNTGVTHVNSRVMAFYLVSSDDEPTVHYQTAQAVSGRSNTYRFYIPADATKITFAHVAENNYVLPGYDDTNDTITFAVYTDHTVLMAWTQIVDLTSDGSLGKNTFSTSNDPGTADGNGIYNYTGTMTTLG